MSPRALLLVVGFALAAGALVLAAHPRAPGADAALEPAGHPTLDADARVCLRADLRALDAVALAGEVRVACPPTPRAPPLPSLPPFPTRPLPLPDPGAPPGATEEEAPPASGAPSRDPPAGATPAAPTAPPARETPRAPPEAWTTPDPAPTPAAPSPGAPAPTAGVTRPERRVADDPGLAERVARERALHASDGPRAADEDAPGARGWLRRAWDAVADEARAFVGGLAAPAEGDGAPAAIADALRRGGEPSATPGDEGEAPGADARLRPCSALCEVGGAAAPSDPSAHAPGDAPPPRADGLLARTLRAASTWLRA